MKNCFLVTILEIVDLDRHKILLLKFYYNKIDFKKL